MRWYMALAAGIAALIAACGGGGNEGAVRDTVEGFFVALNEDPPKAYTYLAQDCKDQIGYPEFFGVLALTLGKGFLGEGDLEVNDLNVTDGDGGVTATFEVVIISEGEEVPIMGGLTAEGPARFVKEDGRWRFADCEDFGGQSSRDSPVTETEPAPPEDTALSRARGAEADDDPSLPGTFVNLPVLYGGPYPDTAKHRMNAIDYRAQGLPPAGGPHWGANPCPSEPSDAPPFCGPVQRGFYTDPWPAESLVHNMEHTHVIVWYNTSDESVSAGLRDFARENADRLLVVAPYPEMEAETIAVTAWSRRDTFSASEYDGSRLQEFLDVHECRFDPEGFC